MTNSLRIGIIGAGIGGVALARALSRKGFDFHLYEQAPAFGEVGAGVQMTPNSVKVLKALGLEEDLAESGFLPEAMVGFDWETADELFRTPFKERFLKAYGAEFYHVHRADLHRMLCQDIPASKVTFNVHCTGAEQTANGATATFSDGSVFEGDLLIGADGIHSAVRTAVWGEEKPKFTGHMCWRALVPVEDFPLDFVGPYSAFWMGPDAHVVTYYVKGGNAVNIVAVHEADEWVKESWTEPSSTEELLEAYQGWHANMIDLFKLTDPNQTFKWGLFDYDPMESWSTDNITLLGDAAHPMLPFLSQGAGMAIEDAYVLAEALAHTNGENLPLALEFYERERMPRTARVQLEARERGKTYHLSSQEELKKRNNAFRAAEQKDPNAVGIKAEWVYAYNATTCRERFAAEIPA